MHHPTPAPADNSFHLYGDSGTEAWRQASVSGAAASGDGGNEDGTATAVPVDDESDDEASGGEGEAAADGVRLYWRLALGRAQRHISYVKRERGGDVGVPWRQTFCFAAPLPLRDRQLRLELYRTPSSTSRGHIVSIANVGPAGRRAAAGGRTVHCAAESGASG